MDLRFRNPTHEPFQLMVWLNDTHLCGEIRACSPPPVRYRVVEKDRHFEEQHGQHYRCNSIWQQRVDAREGHLIEERLLYRKRSLVMYPITL